MVLQWRCPYRNRAATKHAEETQKAAFECAIEAFKQGRTFLMCARRLKNVIFHPYDAQRVAGVLGES